MTAEPGTDATEITNLLYTYAERMDAGRFEDAAALFAHARVRLGGGRELAGGAGLADMWRATVKVHGCGTPRTKHVVANPLLDIDAVAGRATCRSYYTVLQGTAELPLQVVAAGRYLDEFERVDGRWRFSVRDYSLFDLPGNTGEHLRGTTRSLPADRADVIAVINRYSDALDDRDWACLDDFFTEDAAARYGSADRAPVTGRAEIVRMIRSNLDGCGPSQHLFGNHVVEIDGDTALSSCKARVCHFGAGDRATLEPYECFGVYRHTLRRTDAGWRVAELLFDVRHTVGDIRVLQPR
ncbi:nuclear transport factor 2 family protein [Rhodococcus phenolicus]|uniref:nuclear transport factor 2 family protein n=1 Tax=Rhodococcus phenolicus TaxID=263849 RepID=UPI000834C4F1|nr:nuclear transport factor 2 family protein [Rhodococcus phenolicus]